MRRKTGARRGPFLGACCGAILALAGCSDPGFRGVPEVRSARLDEVGACRLISHISIEPGVYGPVLAEQGLRYARNKVLEMARSDGANTVVFETVEPGTDVYLVKGDAYAC